MWILEGPVDLLQLPGCSSHGQSWIPTAKGSALVSAVVFAWFWFKNRLVISSSWFPVYYLLVITMVKTVAGGN